MLRLHVEVKVMFQEGSRSLDKVMSYSVAVAGIFSLCGFHCLVS